MNALPQLLPEDDWNRRLLANVHPADWKNPRPAPRYNLVVLGAGTAGLVCAAGAAGLGARVALVEPHLLGGDCLNYGCVPSKALIASSRVRSDVLAGRHFGITAGEAAVEFPRVMERLRRLRAEISHHDSVQRLSGLGVDVFLGQGRFRDDSSVEVDGAVLRFSRAVIATGARAAVPPIPGLDQADFVTNETVFSLTELPPRWLVLGGGPIGCELAQALARLGAKVTLVEMGPRLLPKDDPEAAAIIARALGDDGVELVLNSTVLSVSRDSGTNRVQVRSGQEVVERQVERILVAAGRLPNVTGLGLEQAGVRYDRLKGIVVNDRLQTTCPRIYAAGDVAMTYKFTHTADAAARLVIQNALFAGSRRLSSLIVPWCTYTSPEVAQVGITEAEAAERGIPTTTIKIPFQQVDRAVLEGDAGGFLKVYLKRGTDQILGATVVDRDAGNLISEITLAMTCGIRLARLADVIHPYPTRAEAVRKAADAYNRTRLTPWVKRLMGLWFRWTR
ncbi:MAG: mercuric reductase [Acidobacteriota bacterium]